MVSETLMQKRSEMSGHTWNLWSFDFFLGILEAKNINNVNANDINVTQMQTDRRGSI